MVAHTRKRGLMRILFLNIMRRLSLPAFLVLVSLLSAGQAPAYQGKIDFAYIGGAYLMDKSGIENETIAQFWENLLRLANIKRPVVKVENFVNEQELLSKMKSGEVVIAGVSHSFFSHYERELNLIPLVVPAINGRTYIYYCIYKLKHNRIIRNFKDLNGKRIAVPVYGDEWYYGKLIPGYGQNVYEILKYPDKNSVVSAVLFKKADAGVSSEHYLDNFFKLRPGLKDKIDIFMKTRKILIPPIVCMEGALTADERDKIISVLTESHTITELSFLLELIGFSGFEMINREEILKAVK